MQQKAMFAKLRFNKRTHTTPPAPLVEKKQIMKARTQIMKNLDNIPKSKHDKLSSKQKKQLETAKKELRQATTKQKFKVWASKHQRLFSIIGGIGIFTGAGTAIVMTPITAGAVPVLLGAAVAASGGVIVGGKGKLESSKARQIIRNRNQIRKELIRQGFSTKQSKQIIKARVITLERKADVGIQRKIRKDNIREQKRIRRLLR